MGDKYSGERDRYIIVSVEKGTRQIVVHQGGASSTDEFVDSIKGISAQSERVLAYTAPTLTLDEQLGYLGELNEVSGKLIHEVTGKLELLLRKLEQPQGDKK